MSDPYDFKMSLFDKGELEEFSLFVRKFNMIFAVSGMLDSGAKIWYLRTQVHGEALRQFDLLYADIEIA